jgi:hypothetical protein
VVSPSDGVAQLIESVRTATEQTFGYCDRNGYATYTLVDPEASIPAGTLQAVIDALVTAGYEVDYIHGTEATSALGRRGANLGLFLPAIPKNSFFASIVSDGALPRKTFSLGEADEKRYYLEARRIQSG